MIRKHPLVEGEFYHIYNRGVEKRDITQDIYDVERFLQSMRDFNVTEPIGSIYEKNYPQPTFGHPVSKSVEMPLVEFVAYCLNPNHYHFLLHQVSERGIEKFMQRLGNGYTKYFNTKYKRVGPLFQGSFKSIHINNDDYLLHLSAYINLNNRVHGFGHPMSKMHRSSFSEYAENDVTGLCKKEIVLERFSDKAEYVTYAEDAVLSTIAGRVDDDVRALYGE